MPLDPDRLFGWPQPEISHCYDARDTILYALGVGVANAPMPAADLRYLYEGEGFAALPTMAVVLGQGEFWMADPELGLDWRRILHGEQMLTLHVPLPPRGTVVATNRVDAIYDKGPDKGAICYTTRELRDPSGTLLATVRASSFLRGDGGFGGSSEGAPKPRAVPDGRSADMIADLPTRPEQALVYRLSGDTNPLHVDPEVARAAGFAQPILHGLCTYGIAGRALIRAICDDDPARLRTQEARFAAPAYPGETIRIEIWWLGDGAAAFRARSLERDIILINNGYCEAII